MGEFPILGASMSESKKRTGDARETQREAALFAPRFAARGAREDPPFELRVRGTPIVCFQWVTAISTRTAVAGKRHRFPFRMLRFAERETAYRDAATRGCDALIVAVFSPPPSAGFFTATMLVKAS
jgi:hypothetical protein